MSRVEDFLSHLYTTDQRPAYEVVLGLVKEVERLNKELAEAKAVNPEPHIVKYVDFSLMVSNAIQDFVKRPLPVEISRRALSPGHETHVFMIEAFIGHLNKHELLRKPVTFDYRR